ncbi:hypothetical protein B0H14DRAFT_2746821 [Mycena olivaceomarginata]|nr:hypothetical protein B0H14DRAFT_2746821 [Mycena olivaceomarginata]
MRTIVALLLRCASPAAQLPRALMMKPLTYRTTAPSLRAPRRHRRPTTITRICQYDPPIAIRNERGKPDRQSEHDPCLLIRCPRARLLHSRRQPRTHPPHYLQHPRPPVGFSHSTLHATRSTPHCRRYCAATYRHHIAHTFGVGGIDGRRNGCVCPNHPGTRAQWSLDLFPIGAAT